MPTNARRMRVSTAWPWYAAAALVGGCALFFGYRSHLAHRAALIESFQTQQGLFALAIQGSITEHLAEEEKDLLLAVREIQARGGAGSAEEVLSNIYAAHVEDFLSLALFEASGELLHATPSVGLWGPDLRDGVRRAAATHAGGGRPFLTEELRGPAGVTTLALCVPFTGVADRRPYLVVGALRIEDFMLRHFPAWQGRSVGFVLADDDGRIVSLMSTKHVTDDAMRSGNVIDPQPGCLRCHDREDFADVARSFEKRGVSHSVFRSPEGRVSNRATVSFPIYNERWALAVISPYESVQVAIDRNQGIALALALVVSLAIGSAGWVAGERARLKTAVGEAAAVRASEERFRAVFDHANDGILIVAADGTILDANRTLHERLGYAKEELVGRSVAVLDNTADAALVPERMAAILREGWRVFQIEHHRKDGTPVPVEIGARAVDLAGEQVVLSVVRDVTERVAAERSLRAYAREVEEANRLKDLFNDIVRHDLLNPLSVARGFAELLPEPPDPQGRELVAALRRALARLAEIIRSAAHLARLMDADELETKEQDLGEVIAVALQPYRAELAAAGWEVSLPPRQPRPLRANPLVAEVFGNLVANAVKFGAERRRLEVTAREEGERWVVAVRDWGPGITPEERDRAFERFERLGVRSAKGMGLGLAIAKRIVELHGGAIRIEDNPEGGCIFVVELPKGGPAHHPPGVAPGGDLETGGTA